MRIPFYLHAMMRNASLLLGLAMLPVFLTGCSEKAPLLDTTSVTSPIDHSGECEYCKKKIDKVTEQNLVTVRGNQHIVCDEKCESDLKDWLAKQ